MPTKPSELLELAKLLLENQQGEAYLRASVSRAYYAALLDARDTFPAVTRRAGESSHAAIIDAARVYGQGANPGRQNANFVAFSLPQLRRLRNKVDYELELSVVSDEVVRTIRKAEEILKSCDEVRARIQGQAKEPAA